MVPSIQMKEHGFQATPPETVATDGGPILNRSSLPGSG